MHAEYRDRGGRTVLVAFSYGAPWEPDSGPDWREHLWRNGPCCFLHFEIFARIGGAPFATVAGQPADLAGIHGAFIPAEGSGTSCPRASRRVFWCNHAAFVWRSHGVQYAATLHSFGAGTRTLLAHLIATLAPTA
jgi:hypothetical protein